MSDIKKIKDEFINKLKENPCHGITIDQPSTHRKRYILSSRGNLFTKSFESRTRLFSTKPSMDNFQLFVLSL